MRKLLASSAILAALSLFALTPRLLHADGAIVTDTEGNLFGPNGALYSGPCHNVLTPSGVNTISCHLEIVSGEAPQQAVIFTYSGLNIDGRPDIPCRATLTPSGLANVECHN